MTISEGIKEKGEKKEKIDNERVEVRKGNEREMKVCREEAKEKDNSNKDDDDMKKGETKETSECFFSLKEKEGEGEKCQEMLGTKLDRGQVVRMVTPEKVGDTGLIPEKYLLNL